MIKGENDIERNFINTLKVYLNAEYSRGKTDRLKVAKRIRDWLTRQPDHKWQKEIRELADKAIANAEKDLISDQKIKGDDKCLIIYRQELQRI